MGPGDKLSSDPQTRRFLNDSLSHLKEYGVSIVFHPYAVHRKEQVVGYYDGENKRLMVCKKNPKWLSIYVHEYCHFLQDIENSSIYTRYNELWLNPQEIAEGWIKGKKHSRKTVKKAYRLIRELELDCERRCLEIIRKYDLPIDKSKFIQEANSILFQYFIEEQKRAKAKELSNEQIEKMPKRLLKRYIDRPPEKALKEIENDIKYTTK